MDGYIKKLRKLVGHIPLVLSAAGVMIIDEKMEYYFNIEMIIILGAFQVELLSLEKI